MVHTSYLLQVHSITEYWVQLALGTGVTGGTHHTLTGTNIGQAGTTGPGPHWAQLDILGNLESNSASTA